MNRNYIYAGAILVAGVLYQCTTRKQASNNITSAQPGPAAVVAYDPPKADPNSSPVVPADQSISKMKLEEGFTIKLIAAEPLVSTPVAMTFDNKGRMWVVEMNNYMPDSLGTGEDKPTGKLIVLADKDNDGVMDNRKVVIDSLLMPRALCLIEGGVLLAEPPSLWYYKLEGDKVVSRTLVDPKYTEGGNVEHQPNGLLRGLDNWIYNANSEKRYRKAGNKWLIEKVIGRGQWGITQDNAGRMYANDNSNNIMGDYFAPSFGNTNSNQRNVAGFNTRTVPDNRVFPIRPTPGVNRGYMKGILDDSLRLVNFTAACGPLIYRGGFFGQEYEFNSFVAEPSANLIKRNIITEKGFIVKGKQAYHGKEFLASIDERFRPVSLYDGPDGALYVLDMYRGIIQHKTYLTPYLKGQIGKRDLTQPLSCGRIYKIYPARKKPASVTFPDDPVKLVALLGNNNGFVRDRAQQILIDTKPATALSALHDAVKQTTNPLLAIHALWTLEGFKAVRTDEVLAMLQQPLWQLRMQALTLIPSVIDQSNQIQYIAALKDVVAKNDTLAAPFVGFVTNSLRSYNRAAADEILLNLVKKYPHDIYVSDAVISNLKGREAAFKAEIGKFIADTSRTIHKRLKAIIKAQEDAKRVADPKALAKLYPRGAAIFNTVCKTCHGNDGNGVISLAPPLNRSEWVTGNKEVLLSIILKGMVGPVKVRGKVYKAPEVAGEMPGFADNKDYTDKDLAEIASYIRASWNNRASKVNPDEVFVTRDKLKNRVKAFTADELDDSSKTN